VRVVAAEPSRASEIAREIAKTFVRITWCLQC
jgi:hypothetical protein